MRSDLLVEVRRPEKEVINELQAMAASGFAGLCGLLKYLAMVQEGRPFTWRDFFLNGFISAACGAICYEVMVYEGFPHGLCGALSGMAGWGGTQLLKLIEVVVRKRLGVTKEDLK